MNYYAGEYGEISIETLLIDLNGTLSVNGNISEKTKELIQRLKNLGMNIIVLTGDQRGDVKKITEDLGIGFKKCNSSDEKAEAAKQHVKENTASIGNARIDIGMFENSKISIATIQNEGIHAGIVEHVDIITNSIEDALALFLDKNSFTSTMKI